jgi:steroid delta-isomerase
VPEEKVRKQVVLEYCRLMNAGDLDGVLALFAPTARFEDPAGSSPMVGTAAIRAHLAQAIAADVRETPEEPMAAMDAEHVVLPVSITLRTPQLPSGTRARINLMSVIRVGADRLIRDVKVHWGQTDTALVESA